MMARFRREIVDHGLFGGRQPSAEQPAGVAVDCGLTPKRLTLGLEIVLFERSIVVSYVAMALGLARGVFKFCKAPAPAMANAAHWVGAKKSSKVLIGSRPRRAGQALSIADHLFAVT